jgi:hypothetical protein
MIVTPTRDLDRFLAIALASMDTLIEQGGNLWQRSSSMLRDLTAATHPQQP